MGLITRLPPQLRQFPPELTVAAISGGLQNAAVSRQVGLWMVAGTIA